MKTCFRIIAVAVTLSILLSLVVIAPLGAFVILAPEPDLLWSEGTSHDVADLATGDLNGDGKDDVVSISPLVPATVIAWSGVDGSILWSDNSTSGYAVAIGDITGDGQNEVIAGGRDNDYSPEIPVSNNDFGPSLGGSVINAYAANGTLLWAYPTASEVHDIEIGDVDGDGIDDVVACNDDSASYIYVLRGNGTELDGWPVAVGGEVVDLAVGQLDGQAGVDIAAIGESESGTLYVYDSSGAQLWLDHNVSGTTVEIGDVDGDGDNEVVAPYDGPGYPSDLDSPGFGKSETSSCWVLAFDGDDGGNPLYSFYASDWNYITDIELGDLDGEPGVEVAAIEGESNTTLFAIDIDDESDQEMWRYDMSWPNRYYGETLAIGDVDRDYKNEVVAASSAIYHHVYAFDALDRDGDGQGDMVWAPFSVENTITDVAIGDLNGDGDQEVAFGTTGGNTVYAVSKHEVPFTSATGTGTVYLDSDPSSIGNPTAVDPATLPDEGKPAISFPHGLFSFNITGLDTGQTATVTITLPDPLPTTSEYWKYGPTPGNTTDHWYQLPMGDNDGDNVITIELVDGGLGDDDLTADGTIIDQGGPGYYIPVGGEAYPIAASELMSLWTSVLIALVWAAIALLLLRPQQN
jgi:hypothetical protein